MPLTYGSLFTGIGGFDLGFDRAGLVCAWQVERDEKCLSQLEKHFPDVPKYEDVKDVGKEGLPAVDLICGGFPCQDLSVAGKRRGLAGERSGLWFEFLRLVTEIAPTWVVIENVTGLLSSNGGRDLAIILSGLEERGYWWAYRTLDAQFFGVAQRRRRVFIVASLRKGCPQKVLFESDSSPWDTPPRREKGPGYTSAFTERTRVGGRTLESQEEISYALTNPGQGGRSDSRLVAFQQNSRDEVRLMNGDGQIAGALAAQPGKQQNFVAYGGNNTSGEIEVATAVNAHGSGRYDFESETFQGNHDVVAPTHTGTLAGGSGQRGWNVSAEDAGGGKNLATTTGVRRLTPLEWERLQGMPDNWTAGQSDSARYKQLGNAVAVPVAFWLGKRLVKVDAGT